MRKFLLLIILLHTSCLLHAQVYQKGDVVLNANYGVPQISSALVRPLVRTWAKTMTGETSLSLSNSGVWNGKLDFGVHKDFSFGLAVSYWDMGVSVNRNYVDIDPRDNVSKNFTDSYRFNLSALAVGARGNYHFNTDNKKLDPYYGIALGVTKYSYGISFNSTYPDKLVLPNNVWKWGRSGWSTYFATTFGMRYYPVKYVGLNFELGWDRGAFLFGGVVFKLHAKSPKPSSE